ncbi:MULTISPECIES: MFS transporter [Microbacterium]|uniref:MFS transporter n=1 Tax=Microbacterium TaxID=33882 RepID=UPI0006FD824D|nr:MULTISPECIES: MFS transporter [unclassified Microbacterium]KQS01120.1 disulfide bond formation protein DsbA [Microbacterium sp. Leaf347]MBN9199079.1 MFS transporter [Microbacterium ginsengisoli]MCK9913093.1 MFS transporter [Microbacteriaceae bacterium K1510]OJU74992.1 MAG: MFS transporter [Microbacterium sp. 71-23]
MSDGVGLRSERGPILLALMVATGIVAIDATILATAVPSVVEDLGGYSQFPWLFSIYLLAQAITVPIYSKLADTIGRKPVMIIGIALFLLGSVLCAVAWSMPALIVFRAIQGLGAGAVQPMAITIAGDIYTIAERAKVQGYIAGVWAAASVVGPALGGIFAQLGIWRWIFWVNLPLCIAALWLIARNFHEPGVRRADAPRHRIDVAGSLLIMGGAGLAILGVLEGGVAWAWDSPASIGVFVAAAVLLIVFVFVERRAAEPVLPLALMGRRLIWSSSLISLGIGAGLIGLTSFVPGYLQHAAGAIPLIAGFAVAALTIGWPIAASMSGRVFYLRIGFKPTVLIGLTIAIVGTAALAITSAWPSVALVALCCIVTGFGFGLVATPSLIAAQASVEWSQRGVVTGANMFARSIGSAVGAAIFGAISTAALAGRAETDAAGAAAAGTAVFVAVLVTVAAMMLVAVAMPAVRADVTPIPQPAAGD